MEAIEPGSSAKLNSYKRFPYVTEVEEIEEYDNIHTSSNQAYSLLPYQKQQQLQPPPAAIYDEPNTISRTQMPKPPSQPSKHSQSGVEPATYDEPLTITVPPLTQEETSNSSTKLEESTTSVNSEEDHYIHMKGIGSVDNGAYETVWSPPQKSETVPKNLEAMSEIALEDLSNLNSNEVQLLTLLQMQKMIQKLENVYDTSTTEAIRPPNSRSKSKQEKPEQSQKLNLPPPHPSPPPFPPPQELEELYDEDIGDEAFHQQLTHQEKLNLPPSHPPAPPYPQPQETEVLYDEDIGDEVFHQQLTHQEKLNLSPSHPPAPPFLQPQKTEELYDEDVGDGALDQQPTRQDLYMNLENLSEALAEVTPPPVPPRTYSCKGPINDRKELTAKGRVHSQENRSEISHTPNQDSTNPQKPQQSSHGGRYPPLSLSKPNLATVELQKSPLHFPSNSTKRHGPPPPTKPKPLSGKHIV